MRERKKHYPRGRGPRPRGRLRVVQILRWADRHRTRTGRWPKSTDSAVVGTVGETWLNLDQALRKGLRSLRPGSSLARILARHRLTVEQILFWSDERHARTGSWPKSKDGVVRDARETWFGLDQALRKGLRSLSP